MPIFTRYVNPCENALGCVADLLVDFNDVAYQVRGLINQPA